MLSQRHDEVMPATATGRNPDEPITFRAASLDEAIELAEKSLGTRARVVAANQLRRGGIGGFFASDLGVEISVVVDDETVEEALARIVHDAAAEEQDEWLGHDELSVADTAPTVRFEDALRAFEAETSAMQVDLVNEFRPVLPTRVHRVPRPADAPAGPSVLAAANVERIEAAYASMQPAIAETVQRVINGDVPYDCHPVAPQMHDVELPPTFRPVLPSARPAPSQAQGLEPTVETSIASAPADSAATAAAFAPPSTTAHGSSQHHTELVVAATEQLIDTISSHGPAGQFSVRVVLRNAQGVELEAFASLDTRVDAA